MSSAFKGISRKNTGTKLRNMTGRLFKSFNPQTAVNPEDTDCEVELDGNKYTIKIGSNVVYAAIHNFGGDIPNAFGRGKPVTIPKRPYFDTAVERFENEQTKKMKEFFEKRFSKAVRTFINKGDNGLLLQFVELLEKTKKDLQDALPVKFQKYIGLAMDNIQVSKDYKGAG